MLGEAYEEAAQVFDAAVRGSLVDLKSLLSSKNQQEQHELILAAAEIPGTSITGSALDAAVYNDQAEIVQYFLKTCHVDVNTKVAKGHHLGKADPPLAVACLYSRLNAAKVLLANGASLEGVVGRRKMSMLASACFNLTGSDDALAVVDALLAAYKQRGLKADTTEALWAVCSRSPNADLTSVCDLLMSHGADITVTDEKGRSLLHVAQAEHIVEMVLKHGGIDINVTDYEGETPLHIASREGLKYVVEALLSNGAEKNQTNNRGQTPYDVASSMCRKVLDSIDTSNSGMISQGSCEC